MSIIDENLCPNCNRFPCICDDDFLNICPYCNRIFCDCDYILNEDDFEDDEFI